VVNTGCYDATFLAHVKMNVITIGFAIFMLGYVTLIGVNRKATYYVLRVLTWINILPEGIHVS